MLMHQMPGYGEPTLACWPFLNYRIGKWILREYKLKGDGKMLWRDAYEEDNGHARAVWFDTYELACAEAETRNTAHLAAIDELPLDEKSRTSLQLKARKAIYIKQRLHEEERLMRQEAGRRMKGLSAPSKEQLILPPKVESYRASLHAELINAPFLPVVVASCVFR